jgi:hypothetical protein
MSKLRTTSRTKALGDIARAAHARDLSTLGAAGKRLSTVMEPMAA